MSQLKIDKSEPDQESKLSGYQQNEIEKDHKKEIEFLMNTEEYDMTTWQSFLISHQYLRFLESCNCRRRNLEKETYGVSKNRCCNFERSSVFKKVFDKGQERVEKGLDVRNLIKTQEMLRSMLYVVEPDEDAGGEQKRKWMRIQRRQRVLEPLSSDFDSEVDDLKDFKEIYKKENLKLMDSLKKKNFADYRHAHKNDPDH